MKGTLFAVVFFLGTTAFNFCMPVEDNVLTEQKKIFKKIIQTRLDNSKKTGVLDFSGLALKNLDILKKVSKKNVKNIKLNNNRIEQIDLDSFDGFKKLGKLDLSNNQITFIHKDSFKKNKKLKELYLGNNKLISLDKDLLKNQKSLKIFDVSDNRLTVIDKNFFSKCKKLKKVNLADNDLRAIHPKLFAGKRLDEINVSGNKIPGLGASDAGSKKHYDLGDSWLNPW